MLQEKWECRCFCYNLTYIPLDICPGVILLDHMGVLFLVFWVTSILLSIEVKLINIPEPTVCKGYFSPLPHPHLLLFVFLMIAVLTGWDEILISFWFAFPLWMLSISSHIYWPFVLLLLRIVCSVHLPILFTGLLILWEIIFFSWWVSWFIHRGCLTIIVTTTIVDVY
jgi:hypothetical protein